MTIATAAFPDPDSDDNGEENAIPHIYQPSENGQADVKAVRNALLREPPSLPTVKAKEVENLNEDEMVSLADNRARMNNIVAHDSALARSEIDRTDDEIVSLEADQKRKSEKIKSEQDEERSYKNTDKHGITAPVIFSKAGAVIFLATIVLVAITAGFLGIEFSFSQVAVALSKLKLGQTPEGARGLVFPATFGSLVALSFWTYAEEKRLHWAMLFLTRLGTALVFATVPILGFAIGTLHLPKGDSLGWTMLLLPLTSSLLVLSTVSLKYVLFWVAKSAFPYVMIERKKWRKLIDDLAAIEAHLKIAKRDRNQAKELLVRVEAVVNEFVGRTRGVWAEIQKQQGIVQAHRDAVRRRLLAEAEEKLSDLE